MKTYKKYAVGISLVLAGLIVGLAITTGFQFTPATKAGQPETPALAGQASGFLTDDPDLAAATQLSNAFAKVAAKVNPSVVTIFTETTVKSRGTPFNGFPQFFGNDDFFNRFFQAPQPRGDMKQMGLGSGVIVDSKGTILTNNHVVDGADDIKVRLMDGNEYQATVKGTDPQTDLAVIEIKATNLRPLPLGDSDVARVGDWVLAIGSPLNPNLDHTVTAGIISAKGRTGVGLTHYEDYIQTDAAINPGNSGGAMVNLRGQLIGINSAIATKTGGNMGIGFAIPVNLARKVMEDIIEKGGVERGWLGVYIQNLTPELAQALKVKSNKGVVVSQVQEDSPADKAGLQREDVILKVDGKSVANSTELSTNIAATSPGNTVKLDIVRDGKERSIEVKLGKLNPATQQLASGETRAGQLGIDLADLSPKRARDHGISPDRGGIVITKVDPGSTGAQEGLREGDIILQLNRQNVSNVSDFSKILSDVKPGETILLYVVRGRRSLFLAFEMPAK